MKNYEITFIASDEKTDIKPTIEKFGGKILKSESLGEKQFTYKIKQMTKGFYTTVIFEIDPEKLRNLNKALLLDEEIIRFLIISALRTDFAQEKPERVRERTIVSDSLAKKETEIQPEPEKALEIPENLPAKEEDVKPVKKPVKKAAKPKVKKETVKPVKKDKKLEEITSEKATEEERLKALDEKLDELLKE